MIGSEQSSGDLFVEEYDITSHFIFLPLFLSSFVRLGVGLRSSIFCCFLLILSSFDPFLIFITQKSVQSYLFHDFFNIDYSDCFGAFRSIFTTT